MSDESRQQDEGPRQPMADPRLQPEQRTLTTMEIAGLWSGWAAALALVVLLFWMAITRSFGLGPKILLGATVVLAVFWGVQHWSSIVAATRGRGARLGTHSVAFVLLVLGILIMVNYVAARHNWRHDLTESKRFSLSDQTRNVVRGLEEDVTIIAFIDPQRSSPELTDRLREYNMLSPRLKLETYDPVTDRSKVEEYNVMSHDTLIIKSGEREERVIGGGEEQITSAILAVSTGEKTRICFLTGHGERSITDTGPRGLGNIKASLENQQYEVEELNLATQSEPQVPGDCAVLVIAGPSEPIREKELDAIEAYAGQGGSLFVALEPTGPDLGDLLEPYGIEPLPGTVYDPERGFFGNADFPVIADYTEHQITQRLAEIGVAFATTRAFEVVDPMMDQDPMAPDMPPGQNMRARPLLKTSPNAWVESTPGMAASRDPGETSGSLNVAVLYDAGMVEPDPYGMTPPETDDSGTRMVIVGDADMMTDEVLSYGVYGNLYFTLNSLNWLVANEKLVSIPPKTDMPHYLTMNDRQLKFVWAFVVGIVPLLIAAAGVFVWWRRR